MPARARVAAKWLLAHSLRAAGVLYWARRHLLRRRARFVLTFHRILPEHSMTRACSPVGMCVSEPVFHKLIGYLETRYHIQRLEEAAPEPAGGRPGVSITFDDGWRDNLPHLRALDRAGHPALVFLVTGKMDQRFPFWPERVVWLARQAEQEAETARRLQASFAGTALRWEPAGGPAVLLEALKRLSEDAREKLLSRWDREFWDEPSAFTCDSLASTISWDEARAFRGTNIRFGSHTVSHPLLDQTTDAAAELSGSREAVEAQLREGCETLAYPNGNWTPAVRAAAETAGYRLACTTEERCQEPDGDSLLIPRFNMSDGKLVNPWGRFSPAVFEFTTVWKAWRAMRSTC